MKLKPPSTPNLNPVEKTVIYLLAFLYYLLITSIKVILAMFRNDIFENLPLVFFIRAIGWTLIGCAIYLIIN